MGPLKLQASRKDIRDDSDGQKKEQKKNEEANISNRQSTQPLKISDVKY